MMTRLEFLRYAAGLAVLAACGKDPDTQSTTTPDASGAGSGSGSGSGSGTGSGSGSGTGSGTGSGSGSGSGAPMASCTMNGTTSMIASNHGHVLVVTKEDIAAGVDKTYNIKGTSSHPHTVTMTAAMFAMLAQNMDVSTVSSNDGHSHGIKVVCA